MEVGRREEFRLEQWIVRPRLLSLDGPEGLVRLQPRVMGVLVALAARAGEVVTRDELVRDVWAGRVVSDDAINRCIVELRRALRDDGTGSVIETVPRVGYRLMLRVAPVAASDVPSIPPEPSQTGRVRRTFTGWTIAVIGALLLAVPLLTISWLRSGEEDPAVAPPQFRRLAVLPLEDRSGDPGFAGGVHDTLTTQLAKLPGLTVISRNSVKQYEGQAPTAARVARELNVDSILSGSVERADGRVRVHVQLVEAEHDRNLWAETYDRPATDVFAVQSEIASAVAEQLRIRLGGADAARLLTRPTTSAAAYEHFMRGREHVSALRYQEAVRELTLAVNLDPQFVAAHALLGLTHTWLSRAGRDEPLRSAQLALAKASVDRAMMIDASAAEAQLALAVYLYSGLYDIRSAEPVFERAVAALPNDALAYTSFAYLRRRQGRLDEALQLFGRALEIDPRGPAAYSVPLTLMKIGRGAEAKRSAERGLAANPDDEALQTFAALAAQKSDCDFDAARRLLDSLPPGTATRPRALHQAWNLAMTVGDYPGAIELAQRLAVANGKPEDGADLELALAQVANGQPAEARIPLARAVHRLERELTEPGRPVQLVAASLSDLALANVLGGNNEAALANINRALELIRRDDIDALSTRDVQLAATAVFARAGKPELAVDAAEQLLGGRYAPSAAHVWCSYEVAALRKDEQFRALVRDRGMNVEIDPLQPHTWRPRIAGDDASRTPITRSSL